jgi:Copper binding proteins, plastocyanin/azurin family
VYWHDGCSGGVQAAVRHCQGVASKVTPSDTAQSFCPSVMPPAAPVSPTVAPTAQPAAPVAPTAQPAAPVVPTPMPLPPQAAGVPHDWHVFNGPDSSAPTLATTQIITGPGTMASVSFTAPTQSGNYFFLCDVHPTIMTGTLVVGTP